MNVESKPNPLVSVVIPCYNQERYLSAAIESVLKQTYEPIELILVDDGSTDATPEILKTYKNNERIYTIHQQNLGLASARNSGLSRANGEFVSFLDSDDLYLPTRTNELLKALQNAPGAALAYSETRYFKSSPEQSYAIRSRPAVQGNALPRLLRGNFIPANAFLVRTQAIRDIGGFDATLAAHEDWDMLIRLAMHEGTFAYVPHITQLVRMHSTNMTRQRDRMVTSSVAIIRKLWSQKLSPQQRVALEHALRTLGLYLTSEFILLNDHARSVKWLSELIAQSISRVNRFLFRSLKLLLPALQTKPLRRLVQHLIDEPYKTE